LILADAGGSNGCRVRSFKQQLQEQVSDRYRLSMVLCRYPTGCSKWNLIGQHAQLHSGTTNNNGLTVMAAVLKGQYEKGQKVSDAQFQQLNIEHADVCAQRNYKLGPRAAVLSSS